MKKTISFVALAALILMGMEAEARSYRVCSRPGSGAHYASVAAAIADLTNVFAGDTLYIEPGHAENSSVTLDKALVLIGPGYRFADNNLNMMNVEPAKFAQNITLAENSKIYGCEVVGSISPKSNCIIERCKANQINTGSSLTNVVVRDCMFPYLGGNYLVESLIIENNLIVHNGNSRCINNVRHSVIRNNTIYSKFNDNYGIVSVSNCEIYNNIIINTSTEFTTTVNPDQTIDTVFKSWNGLEFDATNNVHHNILSNKPQAEYSNCIFKAKAEDVLVMDGNNELTYMHKANGPAVGAGVGGSTCGAYGNYGGGTRPYQVSGLPLGRPYIYDAVIDDTPSSNNTINASFKIKVQNQ